MPVDLIRSQLGPKKDCSRTRANAPRSWRISLIQSFLLFLSTLRSLNQYCVNSVCNECCIKVLQMHSSLVPVVHFLGKWWRAHVKNKENRCMIFLVPVVHFWGNGGVRTWKTKKIGVWFSLALFVTNQKITPIQDGIQNKDYIANFYIVIVL